MKSIDPLECDLTKLATANWSGRSTLSPDGICARKRQMPGLSAEGAGDFRNLTTHRMKPLSLRADCQRQISRGSPLAFIPLMMTLLCHTALAEPLDVYRYEKRLIVVSLPQGAVAEKVNAILASNREKIEERHLKIIDVSEGEQKISTAVRLNPSQTEAVRKQLRIGAGDTLPTFVLIGKDGGEVVRCSGTLDLEKWFTLIDEMPMRRAEMLEQKNQRAEPPQN